MTKRKGFEFSDKINLTLPRVMKEQLKIKAVQEDTSASWIVCEALMPILGLTEDDLRESGVKKKPKTYTERRELREKSFFQCGGCGTIFSTIIADQYEKKHKEYTKDSGLCLRCFVEGVTPGDT